MIDFRSAMASSMHRIVSDAFREKRYSYVMYICRSMTAQERRKFGLQTLFEEAQMALSRSRKRGQWQRHWALIRASFGKPSKQRQCLAKLCKEAQSGPLSPSERFFLKAFLRHTHPPQERIMAYSLWVARGPFKALYWIRLAKLYLSEKEPLKAIELFQAVLHQKPQDLDAKQGLRSAYIALSS